MVVLRHATLRGRDIGSDIVAERTCGVGIGIARTYASCGLRRWSSKTECILSLLQFDLKCNTTRIQDFAKQYVFLLCFSNQRFLVPKCVLNRRTF